MASLMENLIDVLDRESTEYEALLQLSQRKTPIIAGGDLAELQKITDEEQELVRSWSDRARGHFSRVETAVVDVKTNLLYQLEGTEGSWKWKHCGILKNRKKLEMAGLAREKGEIEDGLSCVSSEPEGGL